MNLTLCWRKWACSMSQQSEAREVQSTMYSCSVLFTRGVQLAAGAFKWVLMDRDTETLQLELKRLREGLWLSDYVCFVSIFKGWLRSYLFSSTLLFRDLTLTWSWLSKRPKRYSWSKTILTFYAIWYHEMQRSDIKVLILTSQVMASLEAKGYEATEHWKHPKVLTQ